MPLREELEVQGNWLFQRRSWLPIFICPLLFYYLKDSEWIKYNLNETAQTIYIVVCIIVSFLGLFVRAFTIGYTPAGTSGRNTSEGQKADKLNTTGIYSTVRHPLYLGNFLIFLGFILFTQSFIFILFAVLLFRFYYERIMLAEEEFLRRKYGVIYEEWASRTPAFYPACSKWQKPELSFSIRNVLKREYTAFFEICLVFPVLDLTAQYINHGEYLYNWFWISSLAIGFIIYLILRTLKKTTQILHVDGR